MTWQPPPSEGPPEPAGSEPTRPGEGGQPAGPPPVPPPSQPPSQPPPEAPSPWATPSEPAMPPPPPPPPSTPPMPPPGVAPAGPEYAQQYEAYPAPRKTNTMAIVALILSLAGFVTGISAPIGAILGHVARRQIRDTGEEGDGMAVAAIIIGWVITGLILLACVVGIIVVIVAAASGTDVNTY